MFGVCIKGSWWLPFLHLSIIVLNVIGEEFWWRGYLLPRQELTLGKYAWVLHGLLWYCYRLFWPWNAFRAFPELMATAFVSQKLQSTTPIILAHFIFNGLGVLFLIGEI